MVVFPRARGFCVQKVTLVRFFPSERWETIPLCFIVEYDLFIDFYKDKHLKINYLKFDRKTK